MNKKIPQTDFDEIEQQFLMFQELDKDIDIVNIVSKYHCSKNEIGETTDHVKYDTYQEIFDKLMRDEKYTILLTDDSIITMQYIFNSSGELLQHTLSFLPNYRQNDYNSEDDMQGNADISPKEYSMKLSNYIRIDYEEKGREDYYHALVHLHMGVFKESMRIPLQCFLYPNEFLWFIFKYIYHVDDSKLSRLECELPKNCLLKEKEIKKLRMAFGNCISEFGVENKIEQNRLICL